MKNEKNKLTPDEVEEYVKQFVFRVDVICAMEMGQKIDPSKAYQMIKTEYKILKSHMKGKRA